ncbi:unnamed protein product [Schistosoma curassoni]|uniref:Uncharacterized protein n=1 Tax=Schistosoma curassoni TaxID=6186 RepID=A0A183JX63_9TREM|nr:unnamed protein product [Schistosoma curassoni]
MKKTIAVAASTTTDHNIHEGKGKAFKHNTTSANQITLDGEALESVETLRNWTASLISKEGVNERIDKEEGELLQLNNIWTPKQLSHNTKVRILGIEVKTSHLYGEEL